MRKPRDFLLGFDAADPETGSRTVHVISRTVEDAILFGEEDKEVFQQLLFKQLEFSGLQLIAWCFLGSHFHLLLEIPDREAELAAMGKKEILARLSALQDEGATRLLLKELESLRKAKNVKGEAEIAKKVARRLFDLSIFMKELKMKMTVAYNAVHGLNGPLWGPRFSCVLVQRGEALRTLSAYIDLNPVRAGLVKVPEEYRWCSYAAALGGMKLAQAGLITAVSDGKRMTWKKAEQRYRKFMYGIAAEDKRERTADSYQRIKGLSKREIEAVLEKGGTLTLAQALRCRVRYFTDGVVVGDQEFVDAFFKSRRSEFGAARESGGKRMKGAEWGALRVLRNLGKNVVCLKGW